MPEIITFRSRSVETRVKICYTFCDGYWENQYYRYVRYRGGDVCCIPVNGKGDEKDSGLECIRKLVEIKKVIL